MFEINWAAWLPVLAFAVGLVAYSLFDIGRSEVRFLPKWAWVLICLFSIPLGAIVYLSVGRERRTGPPVS